MAQIDNSDAHDQAPPATDPAPAVPFFTFPTNFAQKRIWFVDQLDPAGCAYNVPACFRLPPPANESAAQRAVNCLVKRHEALRTCIISPDGDPIQKVLQSLRIDVPCEHHGDLPKEDWDEVFDAAILEESRTPFDLEAGPLLRARVLRFGENDIFLLVTVHHVVTDGWSMSVFEDEVRKAYVAFSKDAIPDLGPEPLQFLDFVNWEQQAAQSDDYKRQLDFWMARLEDAPKLLQVPTDRPRGPAGNAVGAARTFIIGPKVCRRLSAYRNRHGLTLFSVLIGTFGLLLSKYAGQQDLIIATPIANRSRREFENIIGCFLNNLLIRMDCSDRPLSTYFHELLEQIISAFENQSVPFEAIIEELQPDRDITYNPIFQVLFTLQNLPVVAVTGLEEEDEESPFGEIDPYAEDAPLVFVDSKLWERNSKFDLSLTFVENDDTIAGSFEYNASLFDDETILRLINHYVNALDFLVRNDDEAIAAIPFMQEAERDIIVSDWNRTEESFPEERSIYGLFEETRRRRAAAKALVFRDRALTYDELGSRVDALAAHLAELGVRPGARVAVCLYRSFEMIIGILAILRLGGTYVPVHPSTPKARAEYILSEIEAEAVLLQGEHEHDLPEGPWHVVDVTNLPVSSAGDGATVEPPPVLEPPVAPAYVLYTSGSTGVPKGVVVNHRAVLCHLFGMQSCTPFFEDDVFIQKHAITFDVSVWEMFLPLTVGATLVLIEEDGHKDLPYLVDVMHRNAVSVVCFLPSVLGLFLEEDDVGRCNDSLRLMLCGAEPMQSDLPARFYANFDNALLQNLYGPTEACVHTSYWNCQKGETLANIPIGYPMPNSKLYILDNALKPLPIGIAGNLYIGGPRLADGYLNSPELTAQKFISNPFPDPTAPTIYMTGDLAKFLPNGAIEFVGRIDDQVKIRGMRVELGEIRHILLQHEAVLNAFVHIHQHENSAETALVAYIIPTEQPIAPEELKRHCERLLPDYMVPVSITFVSSFPVNENDKIDIAKLPKPVFSDDEVVEYVAPSTQTEITLAAIWSDLLPAERIGVHDNFFALGGHSLLATRLVARIRTAFERNVGIRAVFEAPTIERLAWVIEHESEPLSDSMIQRVDRVERSFST